VTAIDIEPAAGKLGVVTPGMGAVATTFSAGAFASRRAPAKQPIARMSSPPDQTRATGIRSSVTGGPGSSGPVR
jgi:hypothetical protein